MGVHLKLIQVTSRVDFKTIFFKRQLKPSSTIKSESQDVNMSKMYVEVLCIVFTMTLLDVNYAIVMNVKEFNAPVTKCFDRNLPYLDKVTGVSRSDCGFTYIDKVYLLLPVYM